MPLMDGNLQFLVENVDIPHNDALSDLVLRQMLLALECIASHDIIHRNIKPENILWEHDEAGGYRFRLSDFGLSGISKLNRTVAETEPFMAPEMFHRRKQTTKVDIWSLFALFVWTRDAEFRRTCHQLRASDVHAWLAHVSQLEQYRDIGGMADMNPTKRPSARRQLAILDGLDDPISPGEDEPGDRLTAAFSQLSDAGYQADTQPYYEVGSLSASISFVGWLMSVLALHRALQPELPPPQALERGDR
jgi:serine/threonine protein kinase